jgi:hypothetical protein
MQMENGVKYRNMWGQVGLMIVTIGIYAIYWFYQTATELKYLSKDQSASPGLYSYYKYGELFQKVGSESLNRWILFLLWIVFSPAVWFIVQTDLNRKATYGQPK